jgi:hypothetical protein
MPAGRYRLDLKKPLRCREERIADADVHQLRAMGTAECWSHRLLAVWRCARTCREAGAHDR